MTIAHDVEAARAAARTAAPTHAIVDLRMPGKSGLALVPELRGADPAMRIVVLTGYASIATAVEAIKLGATHYLAKPVDADDIVAAFEHGDGDASLSIGTETARSLLDALRSNKPAVPVSLPWTLLARGSTGCA